MLWLLGRRQADLRERLERVPVRLQERLYASALRDERSVLVEQFCEQSGLVKRAHEAVLDLLRAVVDEEVHDRLGHEVLDALTDDREVRYDQ